MAVPLTLVVGSLLARLFIDSWSAALAIGLAAMFCLTGVAHFVNPLRRDMIAIVPPGLPAPAALVTITGVLELAGALGLLYPPTRVIAAVCLFVLLLTMFPANVHAARMPHPPASMSNRLGRRTAEQLAYLAVAAVIACAGHV